MEFWGVEVKAGKPLTVTPEIGKVVHISQAALGEGKREKGGESVPIRLNIDDKKLVIGSLSAENFPQIPFDLVIEKEFELSHDWKNGSVYFCGYTAPDDMYGGDDDEFDSDDSEDAEEDIPEPLAENGKVEKKVEEVKPAATKGKAAKPESSAKPKVTLVEPTKEDSDSDDDSEVSLDNEDMMDADSDDISGDDDSEDDDDSDDSDEETPTPKKPADKKRPNGSASKTPVQKQPADKKRPNGSVSKTPVPAKKIKVESAQKTDGKKGAHVATPHPSKKAEKSPATNKQTPKSDAKITCTSCPKTFTSDGALQSHTKAKHAAK